MRGAGVSSNSNSDGAVAQISRRREFGTRVLLLSFPLSTPPRPSFFCSIVAFDTESGSLSSSLLRQESTGPTYRQCIDPRARGRRQLVTPHSPPGAPHFDDSSMETALVGSLLALFARSTCTNGCHLTPPSDVAHIQFQSRIAFKLVWCPPEFASFVLVDDEGNLLKKGTPTGRWGRRVSRFWVLCVTDYRVTRTSNAQSLFMYRRLPHIDARQGNYNLARGGIYAVAAEEAAKL